VEPWTFLLATERAETLAEIEEALDEQAIPHRVGLMSAAAPRLVVTVPESRLGEARTAVAEWLDDAVRPAPTASRFPVREIRVVGLVIALHLALVAAGLAVSDLRHELVTRGGVAGGASFVEPWRLVTYAVVHSGFSHVLWNGLSMVVFAVPLLVGLGLRRTSWIYAAAAVGGGVAAALLTEPGRFVIGSSGAVAGLFGAWIVLSLRDARRTSLSWRARVRVLGIALLVLPSLLSPTTAEGRRVSVSGHLGGMATGMAIGAAISGGLFWRDPSTAGLPGNLPSDPPH
jgi:membrane associated rhomboid family serine protease